MNFLFFDTETTGFPPNARMVSIAWQLWSDNNFIDKEHHIIKPDNFTIPEQASRVHGITTEYALENGKPVADVLDNFEKYAQSADIVIAHNFKFDNQILDIEYKLLKKNNPLKGIKVIDTMLESTNYLKLPGRYGYKWPNLSELYEFLFGEKFDNAHSADADIDATAKCFFELLNRKVIKI